MFMNYTISSMVYNWRKRTITANGTQESFRIGAFSQAAYERAGDFQFSTTNAQVHKHGGQAYFAISNYLERTT